MASLLNKSLRCLPSIIKGPKMSNTFFENIRSQSGYPGHKVNVNGTHIHYEKVGNGPHSLLLLPGAVGSTRTDFSPQLEKLNREKYTIIAWDPPGYGYSRPPDRTFSTNFYNVDAKIANELMQTLKRPNYSIIGWSDGGITGLIMASLYAQNIAKLVVFGASAFITKKDLECVAATRDIFNWSDKMKAPLIKIYGEEYFKTMWEGFCDIYKDIQEMNGGDICRDKLKSINCPTLIIHGDKDPMVDPVHPDYLKENIKNSRLLRFPDGKHNLHLRYADEFNKAVEQFLDE